MPTSQDFNSREKTNGKCNPGFHDPAFFLWASAQKVTDQMLLAAVREMEKGLNDGQQGKFLFKKRIAMPKASKGKSGGARMIVVMKEGDLVIFLSGYSKSDLGNISKRELQDHKSQAKELISYNAKELATYINSIKLIEVKNVSFNTF